MRHLMIDIETLDTGPNSAIIALGAVEFNQDGPTDVSHHWVVNATSSIIGGGTVSEDTAKWWSEQPYETQKSVIECADPLISVLRAFRDFVKGDGDVRIWCYNNWDFTVLMTAYERLGIKWPWTHKQNYDARPICKAAEWSGFKPPVRDDGANHDPTADCEYQIASLLQAMKDLNIKLP